jgi:hypothetical protein
MMERIAEASPRLKARITGAFYLFTLLTGIFAQGFVWRGGRGWARAEGIYDRAEE